ncbi:MAG: carboxypeptidase-like regulatory domain-containing protein [Candidatus Cohnella colombiensis]|uniref:Carboxypeptidase-like regulatory domain-containing protein n=1 Tax=Candidatus Cohnella colombiensis TaxID=3121368 RepID=A0AA95JA95_9BACL|nr:MAG: carboxypeptidase-like regulatory domain-containing protein [Cohnella sp.]
MNKRLMAIPVALALTVGLLSGCSDNGETKASPAESSTSATASSSVQVEEAGVASIFIEENQLSVVTWKMDNSQVVYVNGTVLLDGQPVSGVEVNLGKRTLTTEDNGSFEFLVDRSIPTTLPVSIKSAEHATISGKSVSDSSKKALLEASTSVEVYYPIQIEDVKEMSGDPSSVEVHARIIMDEGEDFPTTKITSYAIMGTIKDASGTPVKDAVVSFVRDRGEGWSKSEPSDENGHYVLYYSPEEDEDLIYQIHVGDTKYTLPDNRVYHLPEDTSAQIDVILPAEGTVIDDKPPTLVGSEAEGALYWSLMVGLSVGSEVPYTVTLPKKDGTFTITLPKEVWDQTPTLFESRITRFSIDPINTGDTVPSSLIPQPLATDPQKIVPTPST